MRYPEFLKENDKISFVATSFGATLEPYKTRVLKAKRKFEKMGYKVDILSNVNKEDLGYLATHPRDMAKEFMNEYINGDSKLLLSVGGGEMQFETLSYLDFDKLNKRGRYKRLRKSLDPSKVSSKRVSAVSTKTPIRVLKKAKYLKHNYEGIDKVISSRGGINV